LRAGSGLPEPGELRRLLIFFLAKRGETTLQHIV
jgi:hypothetical protein